MALILASAILCATVVLTWIDAAGNATGEPAKVFAVGSLTAILIGATHWIGW